MAINVSYQPAAAVIADAAYQGGLGEYRQRQAAQAIQLAQMGLQDQHFQQDLAARQFAQQQQLMANANSQMFNAQRQMALMDAEQEDAANKAQWLRENQLADLQMKRGWDVADQKAQWDQQAQQQQVQRDWAWNLEGAKQLEANTVKGMANYEAQRSYMSPEGLRLLGDLTGKLRAIQKQRASLRPEQYAGLLGQFQQEVQTANLDSRIEKPKSIAERIPQESYQEAVLDPNGEFLGYNVWTSTVRNGQSTLTPKFIPKPKDPASKPETKAPQSFEHLYANNREEFQKDFAATQKELLAEAKANAGEDGTVQAVTHQDVVKAMRDKFDAWQSIQPGSERQPTWGEQVAQQVAAHAQYAQQVGQQMIEQSPPQPRPEVQVQPAAKPRAMSPEKKAMAEAVLPRPKTPQEAASLPPGTLFMGPDGKVRRVP